VYSAVYILFLVTGNFRLIAVGCRYTCVGYSSQSTP